MEYFPLSIAGVILTISAVILISRRAVLSPLCLTIFCFLLCGILTAWPQMVYSENRNYPIAIATQVYLLIASVPFLVAALLTRRPFVLAVNPDYGWKFFPQRTWLMIFCGICVLDPLLSIALHGRVGLAQGNQGMGEGGGAHSEVFTPITFIAWAAAAAACYMVMMTIISRRLTLWQFISLYPKQAGMALIALGASSLSGNRFLFLSQGTVFVCSMVLVGKLKLRLLIGGAVAGLMLFVVLGNFRFGSVDIRDNLETRTNIGIVDSTMGWVVSYFEPNIPNLDNFMRQPPAPTFGKSWLTSLLPSGLVDALHLERSNSIAWLGDMELLAHRGMTFRTWYPDFIMDFGVILSQVIAAALLLFCAMTYNTALRSPRFLLLFMTTTPIMLFSPLLAAPYSLQHVAPFLLLWLIRENQEES